MGGNLSFLMGANRSAIQKFEFRWQDLNVYPKLVEVIDAFRARYELQQIGYKEMDKFLWVTGYELLNPVAPMT